MLRRTFVVAAALAFAACALAQEEEEPTAESPKAEPVDPEEEEAQKRREKIGSYAYCEYDNCYELLELKKDANQISIKRAYRRLSFEWHPDKNPHPEAKERFQKYANAYDVLSNKEMRENYDYLLAHPMEFPMHFMRYSRPSFAPKSDMRVVLVLTVLIASALQHMLRIEMHKTKLKSIKASPRYRDRLAQLIAAEAVAASKSPSKKSGGDRGQAKPKSGGKVSDDTKAAAEKKLEAELKDVCPDPPTWEDTFGVHVFKAPLYAYYGLSFQVNWILKFKLGGQEYGPEEIAYLTYKALGMSAAEWGELDEAEADELAGRELWVAENMEAYEAELSKGSREKSGKEKRAARLKKKGAATFVMDD